MSPSCETLETVSSPEEISNEAMMVRDLLQAATAPDTVAATGSRTPGTPSSEV